MKGLKHFLPVLLLCLSTKLSAQSSNDYGQYKVVNGDTVLTNFPLKTARRAAYKALLLKEYELQIDSLNAQIIYWQDKVQLEQDKNSVTVEHYKGQIENLNEQKRLLLGTIELLNKEIVRLKRGKKWAAFGGLVSTGLVIFLSLKK